MSCGNLNFGFRLIFVIFAFLKKWLLLSQFLNKNLKSDLEVLNLFSVAFDVLFMVLFLKKNLFHFTLFCAKLPHKININPLFFVPHEFPATHLQALYQSIKLEKTNLLVQHEKRSSDHAKFDK